MTASPVSAQSIGPPAPKRAQSAADAAVEKSRELTDPVKRCKPADDGTITVCGSDTDRHRLSPELRAIAGVGKSTKTAIPDAPYINPTIWDQLPYNWMPIAGGAKSGPEYNALYEMAKRATDPDAGVAPPEEPEN